MSSKNGIVFAGAPYANSAPLMHYLTDEPQVNVLYDHPAVLVTYLETGKADVALVPVIQAFKHPEWNIIDGLGVASLGPVKSVLLRCNVPPKSIKTIAYDPASNTSNQLAKWILKTKFKVIPTHTTVPQADAEVVIGDRALDAPEAAYGNIDLSEAWFELTNLPFVFAVWAIRKYFDPIDHVTKIAHCAYEKGAKSIDEIIKKQVASTTHSSSFWRDYLTRSIHYKLTKLDKKGMEQFRQITLN